MTVLGKLLADARSWLQGHGQHTEASVQIAVPGRCHFDKDGWLRGPISITHYTSPNHYTSGFADKARGLVQHTEDGFTAGTVATFLNPASQVSAFFGVGEDGAAQQFLPVGRGFVAWAEGEGNASWRSCEFEDKTKTGQPMTAVQLATGAQIIEACSTYDGFPLQITDDVNGRGLITHGDGGAAWGNHPGCPGPVRKAQRPTLLALAAAIRKGLTVITVKADGKTSLHALAAKYGMSASHLLRVTAVEDKSFPDDVAAYINDVFAGRTSPTGPVPAGCEFKAPK
jgi:hypothetical protein